MSKVGCPIRKSTDQRLFAPSRSLSQRTTSFIASYRQGIHQMPLSHLITLISNAHPGRIRHARVGEMRDNEPNTRLGWPLIRKTRSQIRTNPSSSPLARLRVPPPGRHASHDAAELLEMPMSTLAPRLIPSSRCQDCQSYRASGRAGAEFGLLHSQMHSAGRQSLAFGGARRDRTDDLKLAKLALSQLS